ncbi:hypothetical protein [Bacillus taeanensis]|uniref:Uncharacterized protein n=1 Tax=Bacillus taeanensis TaxID=273032 RepID=A0A366XQM3_9BACI|nr:hypothetical protein [Bacillus taeanensis]RBW68227.1 hypothetical protein DS031_17780 [Bacillus taeanensis]
MLSFLIIVSLMVLASLCFYAVKKMDDYQKSPKGKISAYGKITGAEGIDPNKVSTIKVSGDQITINELAIIPIGRVNDVRAHKKVQTIRGSGGIGVTRHYGELHITFTNKDGKIRTVSCYTPKQNQISLIHQYEMMKVAIERRLGIGEKKIETPTEPYEL